MSLNQFETAKSYFHKNKYRFAHNIIYQNENTDTQTLAYIYEHLLLLTNSVWNFGACTFSKWISMNINNGLLGKRKRDHLLKSSVERIIIRAAYNLLL